MACVSVAIASLSSCFWGVVEAAFGYLRTAVGEGVGNMLNLKKNAEALEREMEELKAIGDDLENKVRVLEQQPRRRRTCRVSGWLERVEALQGEVRSLEDSVARRPAILESCSCDSLHSGWDLGGRVVDLLKCVRELTAQRGDLATNLVDEAPPDAVVPVPSKSPGIVGGEETLSAIRDYLKAEGVGIIGIYGAGGAGKTTLLSEINNQFLGVQKNDFDVVIWVTVSKKVNVHKIQEDIGVRLGFSRPGDAAGGPPPLSENEDDRREALHRELYRRRFLLLLDDVWEKLELEEVGIPRPDGQNCEGKKIVFTTRSEQVCADMGAQQAKVKVGFLDREASWQLFTSNLDRRVDLNISPDMRPLAETVVMKCGGLPLALITMGKAMSNATRVGEWRQAVDKLGGSPDEIRGMKDVLSLLKFSFDRLEDDVARECLLYCALFPEDYDIVIHQLIDYWVGEGFLDVTDSFDSGRVRESRDRGDCTIRKLKDACLLESGREGLQGWCVRMHDVVREMALWLTGKDQSDAKGRFVVCDDEKRLAQLAEAKTWEDARRISITRGGTLQLPALASGCSNLSTVLICDAFSRFQVKQLVVTQDFCMSMPALRVLDLSGTDVEELPDAVGFLAELRHLNLSGTRIRQLPKELGKMVKLRHLDLKFTGELSQIPREAMLTLTGLQTLQTFESAYCWNGDDDDDGMGGIKLSDLGCHLGRLEELSVSIRTLSCLQILANSEKLRKCVLQLRVAGLADLITSTHLSAALDKLEELQELVLRQCQMLAVWRVDCCKNKLRSLEVLRLDGLKQLSDIVAAETEVSSFIQSEGDGGGHAGHGLLPPLFPGLLSLEICSCPRLKDLRWVGELPHLERLYIGQCEGLEELLVGDVPSGGGENNNGDLGPSFPKLQYMQLYELPALRSISTRHDLLFPSLERLSVSKCPNLRRLPLGHRSCKKIREIEGAQEWWDELEWDDYDPNSQCSCTKSALAPSFQAS